MADQANIQSVLQKLAGTASAGQANLPSNINNGNPNTIYNQKPAQGGYLPPVTNGFDQWRINPASAQSTAPINWQALSANAPGNNLPATMPQWPTTVPVVNIPGWGGTTPPATTPPPGTPVIPGTPIVPGTGGNLGNHPAGGGAGGGTGGNTRGGLDWYDFGGDRTLSGMMDGGQDGLGKTTPVDAGAFGPETDSSNTLLGSILNQVRAKTGTTDGISWQQAIDAVVLPGNAYLSASQKWDLSNVLAALAQKFTGIPVNGLMNTFGKYLAQNPDDMKWIPKWLREIIEDHYKDNLANAIAAQQNLNPGGNGDFGLNTRGLTDPRGFDGPGTLGGSQFGWEGRTHNITIEAGGFGPGEIGGLGSGGSGTLGGYETDQE